uniref:Uncharacterized protein n=1 Tax=Noctiluca scintillans TaxID=2966 RepID=A0A6T8RUI0_NOCSC
MYRSSILPLWAAFCAIVSASGQSGVPHGVTTLPHEFANLTVTFAQAPLLSIVPMIGQKLELLGLYHTALVFHQEAYEDYAEQYWTLEFDLGGAGGFPNGILPMLHESVYGSRFEWDHPARWFFRQGLLYNRSHWTKNFDVVATMTPAHFQSLFDDLVMPMNSTDHTQFPQYSLYRVQTHFTKEVLVNDVTCGEGILWALHYINHTLSVPVKERPYPVTRVVLHARGVREVNMSEIHEVEKVQDHYRTQIREVRDREYLPFLIKLLGLESFPYVYDSNRHTYFELYGTYPPFVRLEYVSEDVLPSPSTVLALV